jgi:Uma2 family endonuclease
MTIAQSAPPLALPDHKQLPETDGTFVKNFQEHPQSLLLTSSILPTLDSLHEDGRYAIGQDCGIYWRLVDPPERGAEAPDWFYVPNVTPLLDGEFRRSYVMWKEVIVPLIAIEFVSGNGTEERDKTSPFSNEAVKAGKFWVYEQAIRVPFYAIYEVSKASVEVYELIAGRYQKAIPNDRGHYPIGPLGVEIGIWQGEYMQQNLPWVRWWDSEGNLLLTGDERADQEKLRGDREKLRGDQEKIRGDEEKIRGDQEKLRGDQEKIRADDEALRADRLAQKLRELGINPEAL